MPLLLIRTGRGHHAVVRRSAWHALVGASIVGPLTVAAQATHDWRLAGCAGVGGAGASCPPGPGVWNWSDVQRWWDRLPGRRLRTEQLVGLDIPPVGAVPPRSVVAGRLRDRRRLVGFG